MVYLCGRPACGRESSATLQIDAPSMTISLVDPRVSRDGIPLCPHHADATTPPVGWTMNDLRSENRAPLQPVRDEESRPREQTRNHPASDGRLSAGERGENLLFGRPTSRGPERVARPERSEQRPARPAPTPPPVDGDDPLTFQVSRQLRAMPVSASTEDGERQGRPGDAAGSKRIRRNPPPAPPVAPASRPTRRRDSAAAEPVVEEEEVEENESDKFPWHHHFADDEPAELQAKSPLLSRAFRSSVG